MPSPYKIVHAQKRAFLAAYIENAGSITMGVKAAKIARQTHYDWLESDEEYKAAFEEAKELACDRLEDEAMRRAFGGTEKPVFQGGKKVGSIREYSDTLTIFMLKGKRPDKYRERQTIDSNVTGSMTVDGKVGYQSYTEAQPAPAQVETLPAARHDEDEAEGQTL